MKVLVKTNEVYRLTYIPDNEIEEYRNNNEIITNFTLTDDAIKSLENWCELDDNMNIIESDTYKESIITQNIKRRSDIAHEIRIMWFTAPEDTERELLENNKKSELEQEYSDLLLESRELKIQYPDIYDKCLSSFNNVFSSFWI